MMKNVALFLGLLAGACGSKQTPVASSGSDTTTPPPADTRTEIEKRRDAACETLGPRVTTCAAVDAKQAVADGKITQKQYDEITKKEVLAKNTEEFIADCEKAQYSSRQIRVLEVCQKEESECEPLLSCLENLNKK